MPDGLLDTLDHWETDPLFAGKTPHEKRRAIQAHLNDDPDFALLPSDVQARVANVAYRRYPDDVSETSTQQVYTPRQVARILNKPFTAGEAICKGLDCPTFMQQLYATNLVHNLPRTVDEQWRAENGTRRNDFGELQAGDQLFFQETNGKGRGVASHAGYYLGQNPETGKRLFVHASSTKNAVVVSDLDKYPLKPLGTKRYPALDAHVKGRVKQGMLPQGGRTPELERQAAVAAIAHAGRIFRPHDDDFEAKVAEFTQNNLGLLDGSIPNDVVERLLPLPFAERESDPQLLKMKPVPQTAILREAYRRNNRMSGALKAAAMLDADGIPYNLVAGRKGQPRVVAAIPGGNRAVVEAGTQRDIAQTLKSYRERNRESNKTFMGRASNAMIYLTRLLAAQRIGAGDAALSDMPTPVFEALKKMPLAERMAAMPPGGIWAASPGTFQNLEEQKGPLSALTRIAYGQVDMIPTIAATGGLSALAELPGAMGAGAQWGSRLASGAFAAQSGQGVLDAASRFRKDPSGAATEAAVNTLFTWMAGRHALEGQSGGMTYRERVREAHNLKLKETLRTIDPNAPINRYLYSLEGKTPFGEALEAVIDAHERKGIFATPTAKNVARAALEQKARAWAKETGRSPQDFLIDMKATMDAAGAILDKIRSESTKPVSPGSLNDRPAPPTDGEAPSAVPPIDLSDLGVAYRGVRAEPVAHPETGDLLGYNVTLPNKAQQKLQFRFAEEDLPLDPKQFERVHGRPPEPKDYTRAVWRVVAEDGSGITRAGLIELSKGTKDFLYRDRADVIDLLHESLHSARAFGLISDSEWKALAKRYARGETDPLVIEERIAEAYQRWNPKQPSNRVFERTRDWAARVYDMALRGGMHARSDAFFDAMRQGDVWTRDPQTRQAVASELHRDLLAAKASSGERRIWTPGENVQELHEDLAHIGNVLGLDPVGPPNFEVLRNHLMELAAMEAPLMFLGYDRARSGPYNPRYEDSIMPPQYIQGGIGGLEDHFGELFGTVSNPQGLKPIIKAMRENRVRGALIGLGDKQQAISTRQFGSVWFWEQMDEIVGGRENGMYRYRPRNNKASFANLLLATQKAVNEVNKSPNIQYRIDREVARRDPHMEESDRAVVSDNNHIKFPSDIQQPTQYYEWMLNLTMQDRRAFLSEISKPEYRQEYGTVGWRDVMWGFIDPRTPQDSRQTQPAGTLIAGTRFTGAKQILPAAHGSYTHGLPGQLIEAFLNSRLHFSDLQKMGLHIQKDKLKGDGIVRNWTQAKGGRVLIPETFVDLFIQRLQESLREKESRGQKRIRQGGRDATPEDAPGTEDAIRRDLEWLAELKDKLL